MPQGSRAQKNISGTWSRSQKWHVKAPKLLPDNLAAPSATSGAWPRSRRHNSSSQRLLRPFRAKLTQLVATAIKVVDSAMENDEADHFTRLRAVERYFELLEMAQGKVQEKGNDDAGRLFTWEQFQERYGSRRGTTRDEEDPPSPSRHRRGKSRDGAMHV
jgi:hypothetical protein